MSVPPAPVTALPPMPPLLVAAVPPLPMPAPVPGPAPPLPPTPAPAAPADDGPAAAFPVNWLPGRSGTHAASAAADDKTTARRFIASLRMRRARLRRRR